MIFFDDDSHLDMKVDFLTTTKIGEVPTRLEMGLFGMWIALDDFLHDRSRQGTAVIDINGSDR